jgi:hypothetical protein
MPKKPWLRLYTSILGDPKIERLSDHSFRILVSLWVHSRLTDGSFQLSDVRHTCRHLGGNFRKCFDALITAGLVEKLAEPETYAPHKWREYQYDSDVSTERVQRFRKRQRNVSGNVSETDQSRTEQKAEEDFSPSKKSSSAPLPIQVSVPPREAPRSRSRAVGAAPATATPRPAIPNGEDEVKPEKQPAEKKPWIPADTQILSAPLTFGHEPFAVRVCEYRDGNPVALHPIKGHMMVWHEAGSDSYERWRQAGWYCGTHRDKQTGKSVWPFPYDLPPFEYTRGLPYA